MQRVNILAVKGGIQVVTGGVTSTTIVEGSFPSCTVSVFNTGTVNLATIFGDNLFPPTPKSNPFTATATGDGFFYAANGTRVDIQLSGTGIVTPFVLAGDVLLDDFSLTTISPPQTVAFSATPQFDLSLADWFKITLTGNVTAPTFPNANSGAILILSIIQDVTGGRTWAWPVSFTNPPAIALGSNARTECTFKFDGANWTMLAATGDNLQVPSNAVIAGSLTAKSIGGVQYAAQFAGASTTCGIAEAIAALPNQRGKVILQLGNCSASGWPVNITTPVVIEGHGMGGPSDAGFNASVVAGSSLTNTSTGGSFFVISFPGGGPGTNLSLDGVTLRDFAMIGNKTVGGATAGDCVDINGGGTASQIRATNLINLQCNQPKGSGFVVKDNVFMVNFRGVNVDQPGSHCLVIKDGVNSGVNSQIRIFQSTFDLCGGNNASFLPGTADGINISGSTSREVNIDQCTFADSNNGINVVAGAVNVNILVSHSDFETNTTCDVSLNDGFGHTFAANTFRGTGTGARGICTAMPVGAAAQPNQLLMYGNNFSGHTVQDVTIGANQKTGFILPQASNNYTYADASGNVVKIDATNGGGLTIAATSGFLPATNGSVPLGSSGLAWSEQYLFHTHLIESTPPAGEGSRGILFADSGDHMVKYNPNNTGEQHVPQIYRLTAQYTNSTTGFTTVGTPNIAFPVNANQTYTAECHLYYQAAATGGLNIQFTGPASPTSVVYGLNEPVSATAFAGDSVATAFGASLGSAVTTATTNFDAMVSLTLINGANAGTVTLQAKSSAAAQLQIQIGSWCRVQ